MRDRTLQGLALGASAAMIASALAHVARPGSMARWAAWDRSDWYQREIAVFDLAHAAGLLAILPNPNAHRAYLRVVAMTGLGLGLNHAQAIRRGDCGGLLNYAAATGNTLSSIAALALARD